MYTAPLIAVTTALLAVHASALPASDFVVVGAGTAGCTIAGTLCELLPRATVTLVERGPKRDRESRLDSRAAGRILNAWANRRITEEVASEPNAGLNNRTVPVLLGRSYGGGSAVNSAQLLLPPPGTFASWGIANLTERAAAAHFARLRRLQPGAGAPSRARTPAYSAAWRAAAAAAGLPFTRTPFAPPRTANASFDTRITFDAAGRRYDSCRTFVRPVRDAACRGRLRVIRGARVDRVLFKRARFARSVVLTFEDGRKTRLFARREVLLAAGAVYSAAILLRSGVGPRRDLDGVVRRFVKDLPAVGRDLHSRVIHDMLSTYSGPLAPISDPAKLGDPQTIAQFRKGRGGLLAISPFGAQARFAGLGYGGVLSAPIKGRKVLSSYCIGDVSPTSFGSVRLATGKRATDGGAPPRIALRVLEKYEDAKSIAMCTQRVRDVMARLGPIVNGTEVFGTGENATTLATLDGVIRKVRREAAAPFHYVGTCAVGKVVDSKLRVFGLQRIRVVDSGVIPTLPTLAGPVASVYIVAMHAADLVANDHKDLS